MMISRCIKTLQTFTLLAVLTPTLSTAKHRVYHEPTSSDAVAGAALVAGGVAAAGLGIYALGSWFFTPSDSTVMDQAHRSHDAALRTYQRIISILEREYNVNLSALSLTQEASIQRSATDRVLVELSPEVGSVRSFLSDIRKARETLQNHAKELRKRARSVDCPAMSDMAHQVGDMATRLSMVYHYIKHHEGFFALYPVYQALRSDYDTERQALSLYANDTTQREYQLRLAVTQYGSQIRSLYPYLDYVSCLEADKRELDTLSANTAYRYDLVSAATTFSSQLSLIRQYVMADSEYARSLNARERDRLEQQRLALERERHALELQRILCPPPVVVIEKPRPYYEPVYIVEQPRPAPVIVMEEPRQPDIIVVEKEPAPHMSVGIGVHYDGNNGHYDYDAEVGFETR